MHPPSKSALSDNWKKKNQVYISNLTRKTKFIKKTLSDQTSIDSENSYFFCVKKISYE